MFQNSRKNLQNPQISGKSTTPHLTVNRPKIACSSSSEFRHLFCFELAEKSSKINVFNIDFPPTVSSTHIVSVRTFLDEKNWHKPAKNSGGGEVKKVDPSENPTLLGHGKLHYSLNQVSSIFGMDRTRTHFGLGFF